MNQLAYRIQAILEAVLQFANPDKILFCVYPLVAYCSLAHIRTIHNGERRYACEIDGCTRRFGQNSGLRAHVRTVHLGARDFVCECSRRFGSRGDLNRHIRSTHLKLLPFPCMDCGKAFSRKSVLLRHRAAVHGKNLRTKSPPLSQ